MGNFGAFSAAGDAFDPEEGRSFLRVHLEDVELAERVLSAYSAALVFEGLDIVDWIVDQRGSFGRRLMVEAIVFSVSKNIDIFGSIGPEGWRGIGFRALDF